VRRRVVPYLPYHPVAVDAAYDDARVELLPMLLSIAVATGPTGIATAGIARLWLIQMAG